MKTSLKLSGILLLFVFLSLMSTERAKAQGDYVSYKVFYEDLSPYGQWIDYPQLGRVWLPDAGTDFVPYSTNGHWILSNYGWTWVSDYEWGWAPFHYGRWDFDDSYGWMWIPGYEWGPSWVSWRRADGYYGWAPMGSGLSINISFGRQYNNSHDHWIFVRDRDFDRPNLHNYIIRDNNRINILQSSRVIRRVSVDNNQNRNYMAGPDRVEAQKATGRTYNPVIVRDNERAGKQANEQLRTNRPNANEVQQNAVRPTNVQQREQRTTVTNQRNTNQRNVPENTQRSTTTTTQRNTPMNNQRTTTTTQRNMPENNQRSTTTTTTQRNTPVNNQRNTPVNNQRSTTTTTQRSTTTTQQAGNNASNQRGNEAQRSKNDKSEKGR